MAWRIEGDAQGTNVGSYDGSGWQWQLVSEDDPGASRVVAVRITGTAMAMGEDALTERAALARRTLGRTEVEAVLAWPDPPEDIEITSEGVARSGGNPGPEPLEVSRILEWFDRRGATVFLVGRGLGRFQRDAMAGHSKCSAYVAAKGVQNFMFKVEGDNYLEAARAAKQKWENDGLGVLVELQPVEGKSSTSLKIETSDSLKVARNDKADEAARRTRRESFAVSWQALGDGDENGEPLHLLEITNSNGDIIETAAGDNAEDSLLEIAEQILPSWRKPPTAS